MFRDGTCFKVKQGSVPKWNADYQIAKGCALVISRWVVKSYADFRHCYTSPVADEWYPVNIRVRRTPSYVHSFDLVLSLFGTSFRGYRAHVSRTDVFHVSA